MAEPLSSPEAEARLDAAAAAIRTPGEAERVLHKVQRASAGLTHEAAETQHVAPAPVRHPAARMLLETAVAAAHAPAPASPVDEAVVHTTGGDRRLPAPPEVQRGQNFLRSALMKELSPLRAADARLYVAVNRLPHPPLFTRFMRGLSWAMTGGAGWSLVLLYGVLRHRRHGWRAVAEVAPALILATQTVEHPIKGLFKRRRPFVSLVEAIVVGRRPGSYSFPSGHSASAAAGALLLTRQFPKGRPLFFVVAALVCFSRIFLGAHYPGDVLTGAATGAFFARLWSSVLQRIFGRR